MSQVHNDVHFRRIILMIGQIYTRRMGSEADHGYDAKSEHVLQVH
jgi:hypothetical protein